MRSMRVVAVFVLAWLCVLGWRGVQAAPLPRADSAAAAAVTAGDLPPQRSTVFDMTGRVAYPADTRFNRNAALTIEAWVYPQEMYGDPANCQTFVEHQLTTSYWFGYCPKLRFHRSSGDFVESTVEIKKYRWTHVAVSYDGTTATFYVNGEAAGSAALANNGNFIGHDLSLGGTESFGSYYRGHLDEVRIWSVARSGAEIRGDMFQEVRSGAGLEAVFGDGGRSEDLQSIAGTVTGGVQPAIFGILPRNLVAPRAAVNPVLDANVDLGLEYAGAEQVAVRYAMTGAGFSTSSGGYNDLSAYLVRTDTDLFVGWPTMNRAGTGWIGETSWIGLMLDPNASGDLLAQTNDYQIRVYIQGPWDAPVPAALYVGDGLGGWALCADPSCPQRGVAWDAAADLNGDDVNPNQSIEIRVAKSMLGEWTEVDGLAVGQLELGSPPQDYVGPVQAVENSPITWGQVAYGEGSAQLPQAILRGKVYAGPDATYPPLAGHMVYLFGINPPVITDANGEFFFDVRVPANAQLRLQHNGCTGCKYKPATTSGAGIAPSSVGETFLFFPGCAAGTTCTYRDVQFYIVQPPDAVIVNATAPQARMILNTSNAMTPETTQLVTGENLHEFTRVYLSPVPDSGVTSFNQFTLFEAQVITRSRDMKSMMVRIPPLARSVPKQSGGSNVSTLSANWRWVVKDEWQRAININGFSGSGSFRLRLPEYPAIFGFGFKNEDESASLDQFLAVYGDNAYYCIGAFGFCVTHVPDPLYWAIWYPVFKIWINSSGGSCVGMSSTSLLFYQGNLNIGDFSSGAFFPAGITDRGAPAQWNYDSISKVTGPPEPGNLWAHIRRNHGVQTSSEFLYEALNQLNGFSGDPTQRLFTVRAGPTDFVVSMMKTGGGHAVTPYATDVNRIHIYDNNHPLALGQYIDVDTSANTYSSSAGFSGSGIFAIDIDVWRDEHTMPLDLPQIAMNLVFGSADALYSTSGGQQWGWQPDGTFVEQIPGAQPFVPMGSETNTHNVPLFVPVTSTVVSNVQVNTKGGDYLYYTGFGGNAVQLQVFDAPAGDQDQVGIKTDPNQVNGFSYQPQSPSDNFVPKLGMDLGERQRLMFRWGDLATPGGGKVAFTANPAAKSADYDNDTGGETSHYLIVDSLGAQDGMQQARTRRFGPFAVPNGATHRTTILDWPAGAHLRSELDKDGDGVFEESTTVTGVLCSPLDGDENGLPDACGVFLPTLFD